MSIEWAMWFALGFLTAGILALVAMGAVWRRAVRLTSRRIAASMPGDVDAVRAEVDLLRARHAREGRRFELALADLRRRNADERIDVGRGRAEADRLRSALDAETQARRAAEAEVEARSADLTDRDATITGLEADLAAARDHGRSLEETVVDRDAGIARLIEQHRLAISDAEVAHEAAVAALRAEHEEAVAALEGRIDEARVEIEARKTTLAALESQMRSLRLQLAEATALSEDERRTRGLAETASGQEKDRADRLDRRIARLVADVADREERAERLGRELERARQALVFANARVAAVNGGSAAPGDNLLATLEQLERRNRDLEERLAAGSGEAVGDDAPARSELRRSLADLAAEIVHLTALAEGPSSPIGRIVAGDGMSAADEPGLADRIRTLRKRAADAM